MKAKSDNPNIRLRDNEKQTNVRYRKANIVKVEMWQARTNQKIVRVDETIEQKMLQTEQIVNKKIQEMHQELGNGIQHAQGIATGAALIVFEDVKKIPIMKERLKAFTACIKRDGGQSCFEGKK